MPPFISCFPFHTPYPTAKPASCPGAQKDGLTGGVPLWNDHGMRLQGGLRRTGQHRVCSQRIRFIFLRRAQGLTWAQIGKELGIARESAAAYWRRWGPAYSRQVEHETVRLLLRATLAGAGVRRRDRHTTCDALDHLVREITGPEGCKDGIPHVVID